MEVGIFSHLLGGEFQDSEVWIIEPFRIVQFVAFFPNDILVSFFLGYLHRSDDEESDKV